jgi:hypothetical protein
MAAFYELIQAFHSQLKNVCLTSSNALRLPRDVTPSRVKNSNKERISHSSLFLFEPNYIFQDSGSSHERSKTKTCQSAMNALGYSQLWIKFST